jgi:hypothetical protein
MKSERHKIIVSKEIVKKIMVSKVKTRIETTILQGFKALPVKKRKRRNE